MGEHLHVCPQCRLPFPPERRARSGKFCTLRCARIADAKFRKGETFTEFDELKARLMAEMDEAIDRIFKDPDKFK